MLPGIGIFGSDSNNIKELVIQLKKLDFEIYSIWLNNNLYDDNSNLSDINDNKFQITNSIDNVLLNKNIDLILINCQPTLQAKIASKAFGIGKNVCILWPLSKNINELKQLIQNASYYPSLLASIWYGYYLNIEHTKEYQLNDIYLCDIHIKCNQNFNLLNSTNWKYDKDLGGGLLNSYGASIISFILNLFPNKKLNKVNGCLNTFKKYLNLNDDRFKIREITADDYCNFQLKFEPNSLLVNVNINSLIDIDNQHEILLIGTKGTIKLNNNNTHFNDLDNNIYLYLKQLKDYFLLNNNKNNNEKNTQPLEHALQVQSIVNNIYLSSQLNKWICIP